MEYLPKKQQPEARVSFGLPIISSSEFPNFLPAEVFVSVKLIA
jgi:hypothetical protein